jgi:hypothetical protein
MLFYKACFDTDLKEGYIPGTVTTDLKEAIKWFYRYSSKKRRQFGIRRTGTPIIIKFEFDKPLLPPTEFQNNMPEHQRRSCWCSSLKVKAQINEPVENIQIVPENEMLNI